MEEKVTLFGLSIGLSSEVQVIEHNKFEITGDISMKLKYLKMEDVAIDKLEVIYNHDGLLEDIYHGESTPDKLLLFKEVEAHVNSSYGGEIHICLYDYADYVRLTEDNSIEVYADFSLA